MLFSTNKSELISFFQNELSSIKCSSETKAYLTSILSEHIRVSSSDLSSKSIVLSYQSAVQNQKFEDFQKLGDWIVWCGIIAFPKYKLHEDVYEHFGKLSYHSCNRILSYKWSLYEELAYEFPRILYELKSTSNISIK